MLESQIPTIKIGSPVRVRELRHENRSLALCIHTKHIHTRKSGVSGKVGAVVPGHGLEVWFIDVPGLQHSVAYVYDEFDLT